MAKLNQRRAELFLCPPLISRSDPEQDFTPVVTKPPRTLRGPRGAAACRCAGLPSRAPGAWQLCPWPWSAPAGRRRPALPTCGRAGCGPEGGMLERPPPGDKGEISALDLSEGGGSRAVGKVLRKIDVNRK